MFWDIPIPTIIFIYSNSVLVILYITQHFLNIFFKSVNVRTVNWKNFHEINLTTLSCEDTLWKSFMVKIYFLPIPRININAIARWKLKINFLELISNGFCTSRFLASQWGIPLWELSFFIKSFYEIFKRMIFIVEDYLG